jgi:hypothetical protein
MLQIAETSSDNNLQKNHANLKHLIEEIGRTKLPGMSISQGL